MRLRRAGIVLVSCVVGGILWPGGSIAAESGSWLKNARHAVVLVKALRTYAGGAVPTSGTGFFVNPDGYLITNEHVVGDTVDVPAMDGFHTYEMPVVKLTVVIDGGMPDQRELAAEVVSSDREADLALLRVRYRPQHLFAIDQATTVGVTDRVWAIGFPFGRMLDLSGNAEPNDASSPEPSLNSGRVTAIRPLAGGKTRVIQIDAAVNPGNSGGPLLDERGHLVGVVTAKVAWGEGIAFAIPATSVEEFAAARGFSVQFNPPMLGRDTHVLILTLKPVLTRFESLSAVAAVDGKGVQRTEIKMQHSGKDLVTRVPLTEKHYFAAMEGSLKVTIRLLDGSSTVTVRRFKVPVASRYSGGAKARETTKAAKAPTPTGSSHGGGLKGGFGGGRLRAPEAKDKSKPPTMVIDNSLLYSRKGSVYAAWRYEPLDSEAARTTAQKYENVSQELEIARHKELAYRREYGYRADEINPGYVAQMRSREHELEAQLKRLRQRLKGYDACRCDPYWCTCSKPVCDHPQRPWIDDKW